MSSRLSLTQAKKDPAAFLARLRAAAPAPLHFVGFPDPLPDGGSSRERHHVPVEDVQFIDSLGGPELLLHLRDGSRLRTEGATLAQVLKPIQAAGYRFLKPHRATAIRVELLAGAAIERDEIDQLPPPEPRPSVTQVDAPGLAYEVTFDEEGQRSLRAYDPAFLELPPALRELDELGITAGIMAARRYRLRFANTDATSPIGPGTTEERVIAEIAPYTVPPLTRLDRSEPEPRGIKLQREQGLVTIGGPAFWRLALKAEKTDEEKADWRDAWMLRHLPVEEGVRLFRYATKPTVELEEDEEFLLKYWIDKSQAIRNSIWQVHQWLQWGVLDVIKREDEEDEDDWWDEPVPPPVARVLEDDEADEDEEEDEEDPDANKPNVRTLWYRFGKGMLKDWKLYRKKDDGVFDHTITTMARRLGLVRYRDFGFKDTLRKDRALGEFRPHLLVVTEKDTMEGLTLKMAKHVGGSHLVLSGEPPKITMEYLTEELIEVLKQKGPLEEQEVHVFGLVDFNAAGTNILESVQEDLVHYGRYVDDDGKERKLGAVHAHTLVYSEDMPDELVEKKRTAQIHYREEWVYVGNKRYRGKVFEEGAGNVSRLTFVKEWYEEKVKDPRFHRRVVHPDKMVEEWYYGIEVDDHPPGRLKQRFKQIVTKLKLLK